MNNITRKLRELKKYYKGCGFLFQHNRSKEEKMMHGYVSEKNAIINDRIVGKKKGVDRKDSKPFAKGDLK